MSSLQSIIDDLGGSITDDLDVMDVIRIARDAGVDLAWFDCPQRIECDIEDSANDSEIEKVLSEDKTLAGLLFDADAGVLGSIVAIAEALRANGAPFDEPTPGAAAREWIDMGFSCASAQEWVGAGAWRAEAAHDMCRLGMTAAMAVSVCATLTGGDSVAAAVSCGDITAHVAHGIALVSGVADLPETGEDDVAGEENIDCFRDAAADAGDLEAVALCDLAQMERPWAGIQAHTVQQARRRVDRIIAAA